MSRFRATWVVFTDTSYVTHSKDKDGWEIGGIFALIFSSSLYYNTTLSGDGDVPITPEWSLSYLSSVSLLLQQSV